MYGKLPNPPSTSRFFAWPAVFHSVSSYSDPKLPSLPIGVDESSRRTEAEARNFGVRSGCNSSRSVAGLCFGRLGDVGRITSPAGDESNA